MSDTGGVVEVAISIKNEEKSQVHRHLIYAEMMLSHSDETLQGLVRAAVKEFGNEITDITIKAKMVWQ